MLAVLFIIWVIGAGIIGWVLGSNHEMLTNEACRKADMKLAQKLINEQYERGYKDGFMAKVTPNEIRKAMGVEPVKEFVYVEQRVEDSQETT